MEKKEFVIQGEKSIWLDKNKILTFEDDGHMCSIAFTMNVEEINYKEQKTDVLFSSQELGMYYQFPVLFKDDSDFFWVTDIYSPWQDEPVQVSKEYLFSITVLFPDLEVCDQINLGTFSQFCDMRNVTDFFFFRVNFLLEETERFIVCLISDPDLDYDPRSESELPKESMARSQVFWYELSIEK